MKKDYDVVQEAYSVIEAFIRRRESSKKQHQTTFPMYIGTKKPQNLPVFPIIALAIIFTVLCIANIVLWFMY